MDCSVAVSDLMTLQLYPKEVHSQIPCGSQAIDTLIILFPSFIVAELRPLAMSHLIKDYSKKLDEYLQKLLTGNSDGGKS